MAFIDNIRKLFRADKEKSGVLSGSDFNLASRVYGSSWTDRKYIETYGKSLYVYACVSKIAEKVASIGLRMNRIIDSKGNTEEIIDHPALDLLYKPNPFFTKAEFLMTDVINRKLTGDSFILKLRNNYGQVVELWNISPDRVTIYPDREKYIGYYTIITADGKQERVETEDMIHIKYPSPLEDLMGMSPLSPAKYRVDTEEYASKYQRDFFLNNARPDALIEMPDNATSTQVQEIRDAWEKKHRGVGNSSKIGMLFGGAKYHQYSLTQQEMDYIESMKFTRDDILVAFKVPKPIVAVTDDVNRANAETAQEIFLSETIIPEMEMLVGKLNEELIIPDFKDSDFLSFEDPVPVNREMRLAEFSAGVGKWITRNEARQEMGLDPIQGGDLLYEAAMNMPIGDNTPVVDDNNKNLHGKVKLKLRLKIKEEIENSIAQIRKATTEEVKKESEPESRIKENSLFKKPEVRKQYVDYRMKDIDRKAKRVRALTITLANAQRDKFIKEFNDKKPTTKAEIRKIFNTKEQNKTFKESMFPLMLSIFKESGQDALNLVSLNKPFDVNKTIQKGAKKSILDLLTQRAVLFATSVNDTTLLGLTATLAQGIDAGESTDKLEDRIKNVYREFPDYRAERVSRTETNAVVNEAHKEAYDQSGAVEGKEWVATLDDRVRDEHLMLDGEQVGLDDNFSNGLPYPSEINCRCTISPIIHLLD